MQPIIWDLRVRERRVVDGLPVISDALLIVWNPHRTGKLWRTVFHWKATEIEKVPITRFDLEIVWPPGTHVLDLVNDKEWVVGQPESLRDFDRSELHRLAEEIRAGLAAPAIRSRRQHAMVWILAGAAVVALVVGGLGYRLRRELIR